jgi:hypothetical protein
MEEVPNSCTMTVGIYERKKAFGRSSNIVMIILKWLLE